MSDHAACSYKYRVAGTAYSGSALTCAFSGDGSTERHAGSTLSITYLPDQPGLSIPTDLITGPTSIWTNVFVLLGISTGISVFVYFLWRGLLRRPRRSTT
jgi:hypothetical protein